MIVVFLGVPTEYFHVWCLLATFPHRHPPPLWTPQLWTSCTGMMCNLSRLCCSSAVEHLPSLQEALVQFPARQKQHENLILLLLRIFWYNRDLVSKSSVVFKRANKNQGRTLGGRGLGFLGIPCVQTGEGLFPMKDTVLEIFLIWCALSQVSFHVDSSTHLV